MSTEGAGLPPARRFALVATVVIGVLIVLSALTSAAVFAQGPRISSVTSDPQGATTTSGSRVIFTANQPVAPVSAGQVTVEPAAPFTVDTSGRQVGVRFTAPLADGVEYSVSIANVTGVASSVPSTFRTQLRTPPLQAYLLERSESADDRISRTTMTGTGREVVFSSPHIEDFRASPRGLVVSLVDADEHSALTLVPADGSSPVPLALPGAGHLFHLQVSDSGDRVGYTWTTRGSTEAVVYTSSIATPQALPRRVDLGNENADITDFRFVPTTSSLLLINRENTVLLTDPVVGGEPGILGRGSLIDGIAADPLVAFLRTPDGPVSLDLTTGERTPLATDDATYGRAVAAERIPGAGVLSTYLSIGAGGAVAAQTLVLRADDATRTQIASIPPSDAVIQVCTAPNGRSVAVAIAPSIGTNPIDDYLLAMPETMTTRIISLDGETSVDLPGFAMSWCRSPAA